MHTNYTCVFATKQGFVASLTFVVSGIKTWDREAQPKTHNNSNTLSPLSGHTSVMYVLGEAHSTNSGVNTVGARLYDDTINSNSQYVIGIPHMSVYTYNWTPPTALKSKAGHLPEAIKIELEKAIKIHFEK